MVTEAIGKMNLLSKDSTKLGSPFLQSNSSESAPLATPEVIDLGPEYSQVKDFVHNMYPVEAKCMYTARRDSLNTKSKLRQRREKDQRCKFLNLYTVSKQSFLSCNLTSLPFMRGLGLAILN